MIIDGSKAFSNQTLEVDYCIIGSGSGGAFAASLLSEKGYKVAIIEEGPYQKTSDFKDMRESRAYPELYQELASRKTKNKAVNILQGRNVGGGTTVNWTTCFRTPENTLKYWRDNFDLPFTSDSLAHHFEVCEKRFSISPWEIPPNTNNSLLAKGMSALGREYGHISRNVKDCYNLGYCGVGCPTGAKQSQLVTSIPRALALGAILAPRWRAYRLAHQFGKVSRLEAYNLPGLGNQTGEIKLTIKAREFIVAAGAIGTPALLMRSRISDASGLLGKRTFIHPTVISGAIFEDEVQPYLGAPQSIYSDHYLWQDYGFKLEVPPVHPVLLASTLMQKGDRHRELMLKLNNLQVCIALQRDGFFKDSVGGNVELNSHGEPVLDYEWSEAMGEGFKQALLAMAELQFAAGAKEVLPIHASASTCTSIDQLSRMLDGLSMQALAVKVVAAHVMGGACFGTSEKQSVTNLDGRVWRYHNLSVMDGSLFPTSIAANPMLSILGHTHRIYS
ncbi:MAG: GMC family oxidoreductase [Halobacteriovorax sp.]|nr:GMC family oxidoreductase [Halobacteriovorax sp.]